VGAVGFVSVLFPTLLPLGLIKVDRETGKEIRDANGLCIRCGPGEPGEFVGLIQVSILRLLGSIFKRIFAPTGKVCDYSESSRLREKFAPSFG
jgi:hypothetical protein